MASGDRVADTKLFLANAFNSSNMLYPKEARESNRLIYCCRTCDYKEEATSTCVFRNVLNTAVGETAGVTQDVGSDPTVSLSFLCLPIWLRLWRLLLDSSCRGSTRFDCFKLCPLP
jgi:hypothetical protein